MLWFKQHLALKSVDGGITGYFAIVWGFQISTVNLCMRLPPPTEGEMPPMQDEIENTAEFLVRLVRRVQMRLPRTFFHGNILEIACRFSFSFNAQHRLTLAKQTAHRFGVSSRATRRSSKCVCLTGCPLQPFSAQEMTDKRTSKYSRANLMFHHPVKSMNKRRSSRICLEHLVSRLSYVHSILMPGDATTYLCGNNAIRKERSDFGAWYSQISSSPRSRMGWLQNSLERIPLPSAQSLKTGPQGTPKR